MTKLSRTENGNGQSSHSARPIDIKIMSFGYKADLPPVANMVFDVRFLKNPFWVEELRPLTGLDKPVQEYVLDQPLAQEFLASITSLAGKVLQSWDFEKNSELTIAFGCTGGQHRSTTLAEELANRLEKEYPMHRISKHHRELAKQLAPAQNGLSEDT